MGRLFLRGRRRRDSYFDSDLRRHLFGRVQFNERRGCALRPIVRDHDPRVLARGDHKHSGDDYLAPENVWRRRSGKYRGDVAQSVFAGDSAKAVAGPRLIAGIILIPFNYYNIYKSQANDSKTMKCEIEKVNTKGKSYLYFKVDNKTNLINGYIRNMKDINNSNANKYWLILKTRPGLLGTYIVENWDIEHK